MNNSNSVNRRPIATPLTWALVGIVVLAAGLRFWHLGTWSLWEDEVLTVLDAQDFPEVLRVNPLPYLLTKLTLGMFGNHAWGARVGFALVGLIGVITLFPLVQRIYDRQAALWTTTLAAVLPWHLFWSQNARSYSLTFLFGGLAAFMFYIGLERDRWGWFVGTLASLLALLLSHLLSVALIAGLMAYALLVRLLPTPVPRGWRWRYLLFVFGPFVLMGSVLLHPTFLGQLTSGWGLNLWARSPFYVLATFVYGLSIPVAVLCVPPFLQLLSTWRRDHLFLLCFGGVPVLLFVSASLLLNVAGYYLFFCTPAYLTLAGWSIARCVRANSQVGWIAPALVLSVLLSQDFLYHTVEQGGRPRWREAMADLRREAQPGDAVVIPMPRLLDYYWPQHAGERIKPKRLLTQPAASLRTMPLRNVSVWFLLDDPTLATIDPAHRFRDWLYQHARLHRRYPLFAREMDRSLGLYRLDPGRGSP